MFANNFESEWLTAKDFRQAACIGRTKQWELMKARVLRQGVHYMRTGVSSRSALMFNLPACELALRMMTQS